MDAHSQSATAPTATRNYFPSTRALVLAWAALIVLTLATMGAGRVTENRHLGPTLLGVLLVITWLKASIILRQYLNLRTIPAAADGLMIVIALILAIVACLYVLRS